MDNGEILFLSIVWGFYKIQDWKRCRLGRLSLPDTRLGKKGFLFGIAQMCMINDNSQKKKKKKRKLNFNGYLRFHATFQFFRLWSGVKRP